MVREGIIAAARPPRKFRPTPAECKNPLSSGQDLPFHIRVRFPTHDPAQHVQVNAMIDPGNRMPGSAVISESLMHAMGVQRLLIPTRTRIITANERGQPLQVLGELSELYMAVSHSLILHLYRVTVVRNLPRPLSLGGVFLCEFGTRLCFDMQTPCLWVRGEFIPLHGAPVDRETAKRELSYEGPPEAEPVESRPAKSGTGPVKSRPDAPGAALGQRSTATPGTEPVKSRSAKSGTRPVKSRPEAPGTALGQQSPANPKTEPAKPRPVSAQSEPVKLRPAPWCQARQVAAGHHRARACQVTARCSRCRARPITVGHP